MKFYGLLLTFLAGSVSHAFPDMVRHGYLQCVTCHVSVTGGNLLNSYGRSISKELLSQPTLGGKPSLEGDEEALYGFAPAPEWLVYGGDIRLLQTFIESKQASKGRFFVMQVDLDFAATLIADRLKAFFSIGRIESRLKEATAKDFVSSPRHGLEYVFSDPEASDRLGLRVGRFMPAFGIGFAEHTFVSRGVLGFGPGQERYAAELSWFNESYQVTATGVLSQASGNQILHENGGVLQVASAVGTDSKVGLNYYQSRQKTPAGLEFDRKILGAFTHWAFTKEWYALWDLARPQGADKKWGLVSTFKFGHEFHQGLHLLGVHEFANLNMEQTDPRFEAYSIGAQWFPRPHWDFLGYYRKERTTALNNDFQDAVWLIGHFYL